MGGGRTYLRAEPESGGGEAERGRGEEGRVGEVEGEEDEVPEEILRGGRGVSWGWMMEMKFQYIAGLVTERKAENPKN